MHLNRPQKSNTYISVDEFVQSAKGTYGLSKGQMAGFSSFMKDLHKYYLMSERDFVPYLKRYLGK